MKKVKFLAAIAVTVSMLSLTSCSEEQIASCTQVATLAADFAKAGSTYANSEKTAKDCAAYKAVADSYIAALKGCSTTASATISAVEAVAGELNCEGDQETPQETAK